jgi:hypothetical protein
MNPALIWMRAISRAESKITSPIVWETPLGRITGLIDACITPLQRLPGWQTTNDLSGIMANEQMVNRVKVVFSNYSTDGCERNLSG